VFHTEEFDKNGFAIVPDVVGPEEIAALLAAVAALRPGGAALDRRGRVYASRKLLRMLPEVRGLARSASLRSIVERALGTGAFPVRGLLFDKTTETNWMVPWHQDLTIAVRARVETPGFAPWTVKEGVPHVQPPVEIMARMVAVRVPLDEDEPSRGPLRVIPGSHREGRLGAEATQGWLRRVPAETCLVPRGGALLMRPLLLHSSRASDDQGEAHRRVIHLEFAAEPLPGGLEWDEFSAVDLEVAAS
jgi:Phytanoyl-CoA dioxygenase (PhyH)